MIANFEIKNILIIQTAFPGDIILTTPLIKAAHLSFPDANIDFLTIPACVNLVETHPDLREVVSFDKHLTHRGLFKLFRLSRELKNRNYDLALVPHRSVRSAILAFGARIPKRIGFDTSAGAFLLTERVKYPSDFHEVERNLHLLSGFGTALPKLSPQIFPTPEDRAVVNSWLAEKNINSIDQAFSIAPGSVWETKKWPKENFAQLCDLFFETCRQPVFLIGSRQDFDLCEWICQKSSARIFNTAGQFTFRQSAELISRCKVLVTNDSAPLHLGVAVGTPVIAIFGPTVPAFGFYPYGTQHATIEKEIHCRPCGIHGGRKCPTGTFSCMKSIKADEILALITKKY